MASTLYNLEKLIEFRHWMHQNAELSMQEFKTQQKIKEYFVSLGVEPSKIKVCGKTGLIIDIYGKAAPKGKGLLIGARADIDALPLWENNDLPYKSTRQVSHMCGHDGHAACLLGGASLYMENLENIPSNRGVRFQIQPGEEGYFGAKLMVEDGAIEGVDEVYGNHNVPSKKLAGKMLCKSGPMMSCFTILRFKVKGQGGHGSRPEDCKNPVPVAAELLQAVNEILDLAMRNDKQLRGSVPMLLGSNAKNVIPDVATIEGTIRNYNPQTAQELVDKIEKRAQELCDLRGFELEMDNLASMFKPVINDEEPTLWVKRAVAEVLGEECNSEEGCPIYASEDFSDFTENTPGAFWFVAHGKNDEKVTLHSSEFRFDDEVIEPTSKLWSKLFELRLNSE